MACLFFADPPSSTVERVPWIGRQAIAADHCRIADALGRGCHFVVAALAKYGQVVLRPEQARVVLVLLDVMNVQAASVVHTFAPLAFVAIAGAMGESW